MSITSDNIQAPLSALPDFLRVYPSNLSNATGKAYAKSVKSFLSFTGDEITSVSDISETLLADWFTDMLHSGLSIRTAIYYLDNLRSCINAFNRDADPVFVAIRQHIRNNDEQQIQLTPMSDDEFARLTSMMRNEECSNRSLSLFTDIARFILLNPRLNIEDVIRIGKSNIQTLSSESRIIAERYSDSRRKYVFPLKQAVKTTKQITAEIDSKIISILKYYHLRTSNSAINSLRNLWFLAALRSNLRASVAIAALGDQFWTSLPLHKNNLPILNKESLISIRDQITSTIIENPYRWHILRMRRGTCYEMLKDRMGKIEEILNPTNIFYPTEEIVRKIGKKIVYQDKPVIPGLVFIKIRATDVSVIMRSIGDLAWCMRDASRRDHRYAVVSKAEMETFQRIIGKFTPEYSIYPLGTIRLHPEDKVVIIGGDYTGTEAIVKKAIQETNGNVICRIRFIDDTGFEWTIPADQRLLRKI